MSSGHWTKNLPGALDPPKLGESRAQVPNVVKELSRPGKLLGAGTVQSAAAAAALRAKGSKSSAKLGCPLILRMSTGGTDPLPLVSPGPL